MQSSILHVQSVLICCRASKTQLRHCIYPQWECCALTKLVKVWDSCRYLIGTAEHFWRTTAGFLGLKSSKESTKNWVVAVSCFSLLGYITCQASGFSVCHLLTRLHSLWVSAEIRGHSHMSRKSPENYFAISQKSSLWLRRRELDGYWQLWNLWLLHWLCLSLLFKKKIGSSSLYVIHNFPCSH